MKLVFDPKLAASLNRFKEQQNAKLLKEAKHKDRLAGSDVYGLLKLMSDEQFDDVIDEVTAGLYLRWIYELGAAESNATSENATDTFESGAQSQTAQPGPKSLPSNHKQPETQTLRGFANSLIVKAVAWELHRRYQVSGYGQIVPMFERPHFYTSDSTNAARWIQITDGIKSWVSSKTREKLDHAGIDLVFDRASDPICAFKEAFVDTW